MQKSGEVWRAHPAVIFLSRNQMHPLNLVHLFLINKKHREIFVVVEKYMERQSTESNANVILCLEHLHQQHPLLIQQSHPPLSPKPDL